MELWKKDSRKEPVITDLNALVPADHLLRKIDRIMDYEWLYEKLPPYYCHDNLQLTVPVDDQLKEYLDDLLEYGLTRYIVDYGESNDFKLWQSYRMRLKHNRISAVIKTIF